MVAKTRAPWVEIRWRAHDAAGVGHALPRHVVGYTRYLCNRMPIAERFAWPVKSRCPSCVALLEAPIGV